MKLNEDRVPSTVEEAVQMIVDGVDDKDREFIQTSKSESTHFFGGMYVRNLWSMWNNQSPLIQDAAKRYKIAHADDVSGLILAWVWARVRGDDFSPDDHCLTYHRHWEANGTTALKAGGVE